MEYLGLTSVAEIYKFIKQFHFEPGFGRDPFAELTFSNSVLIRLDPKDYHVRLRGSVKGVYSTLPNIWFRTWVTNPTAVRKLLMVQTFPPIQPPDTTVQLRLYDGTNDLYWDGADWSIAGVSDWNTEAEINAHIETFPVLPDRQFAVTVNLQTTDEDVSPKIEEIRVLMEIHIDYIEDIILRSLFPLMSSTIRPPTNLGNIQPYTSDVSSIDLDNYRINTPYNIVDVDRVFDFTDDPNLLYNLFDSYNPTTKVIQLSSDLPTGHRPFIIFRYEPELVFITHQDWEEVAKVPALIIQRLEIPSETFYNSGAREGIVDRGTGNAWLIPEPWRSDLELRIHGITSSLVDSLRLQSALRKFFENNQFLRSIGLDEKYRMEIDRQFRGISTPGPADERVFWTRFTIFDVRMPFISRQAYGVQSLNMTYQEPAPAHEDPLKGGSKNVPAYHRDDGPVLFSETKNIT